MRQSRDCKSLQCDQCLGRRPVYACQFLAMKPAFMSGLRMVGGSLTLAENHVEIQIYLPGKESPLQRSDAPSTVFLSESSLCLYCISLYLDVTQPVLIRLCCIY